MTVSERYYKAGTLLIREQFESNVWKPIYSYFNEYGHMMVFCDYLCEDLRKAERLGNLTELTEIEWAKAVEAARKEI